jgi:hypothetical protein
MPDLQWFTTFDSHAPICWASALMLQSTQRAFPGHWSIPGRGTKRKVSNLLAGFSAAQSFLDRTKHCAEALLEAAEVSPGASKFCRGERRSWNPTCSDKCKAALGNEDPIEGEAGQADRSSPHPCQVEAGCVVAL